MSNFQDVADRFEIEALRGEFTDAGYARDYDRLASLFTPDGVLRMPHIDIEFAGPDEISAGVQRLQGFWEFFIQNTHRGTVDLDADTAVGRTFVTELGRMQDGSSHLNHSVYHDRFQRTADGWKFAERVYEVRYVDTSPLEGSAPNPAPVAEPRSSAPEPHA